MFHVKQLHTDTTTVNCGRKIDGLSLSCGASENFFILRFVGGPAFQKITSFQAEYGDDASNPHHGDEGTQGKKGQKHQDQQ